MATHDIVLKGVSKRFGDEVALHELNLTIHQCEMMVLLGPSGCGKSTTLNILAGVEESSVGEVWFGDQLMTGVPPEERDISMVFQSIALYPHLNVRQNIAFPLQMRKVPPQEIERRIHELTEMLRIERLLSRRLHELSGGQRQRVAIAKALAKRPKLFLLDEPFSALDAELRRQLRAELVQINHRLGTTSVFVTHDQEEAMSVADRVAVMNQGRVEMVGTPLEVYYQPANTWVAQFVGTTRINFWDGAFADGHFRTQGTAFPVDPRFEERLRGACPGDEVSLGIRPEFLLISPEPTQETSLEVQVNNKQILGNQALFELSAGGVQMRAVVPSLASAHIGVQAYVGLSWEHVLLFDPRAGSNLGYSAAHGVAS